MRVTALSLLVSLAVLSPACADALRAGPGSLTGVLRWVPSKAQEGGEDLGLVTTAGDTIRFWSGGTVDGAELEKAVGKPVTIDGTVHEYTGAWFIAPSKLSVSASDATTSAAASAATTAAAPRAPISASPQRASDIASQWFLDQHRGARLEPVVRVKRLDGNVADVYVVGQSEDGQFSEGVKLSVDVEKGTAARQE